MTAKQLREGIHAYAHQQKVFIRLLQKRGSFTGIEFDAWFRMREWRRPIGRRGTSGDTFILGLGMNGGNLWAEMLELLQYMVRLGDVNTRTDGGLVVYSLGAGVK